MPFFQRDADQLMLSFVVKNIGNEVAYDTLLSLSRPLPAEDFERDNMKRAYLPIVSLCWCQVGIAIP